MKQESAPKEKLMKQLIWVALLICLAGTVLGGSLSNSTVYINATNLTIYTDDTLYFENLTATTKFECLNCNTTNNIHWKNLSFKNLPTKTCYQETANISTNCGGKSTGKYAYTSSWQNKQYANDGNWNTNAYITTTGQLYYANYTRPLYATGAQLVLKTEIQNPKVPRINTTQLPNTCILSDKISVLLNFGYGAGDITVWCLNTTNEYTYFYLINGWTGASGNMSLWEEAINWNQTIPTIAFNTSQLPKLDTSSAISLQKTVSCPTLKYNFTETTTLHVPILQCAAVKSATWTNGLGTETLSGNTFACNNATQLKINVSTIQCPTSLTTKNTLTLAFPNTFQLNITIFDEETNKPLAKNTTILLLSLNNTIYSSISKSFDKGYAEVNISSEPEYEIRYTSPGYVSRTYWFRLSNLSGATLKLFLLNSSYSTNIYATVRDETGSAIENVYLKALRFYNDSNSYEIIEMARTDSQGQALLHLKLNSEWYKFVIQYLGLTKQVTTPKQIVSTSIYFSISILENYIGSFLATGNLYRTLTYNNNTYTFTYFWNDAQNFIREACLKITQMQVSGTSVLSDQCLQAQTGTLTYTVPSTPATYIAEARIDSLSNHSTWTTDRISTTILANAQKYMAKAGLVLGGLTVAVAGLIGFWNPAVAVALTVLVLIGGSLSGLWVLSLSAIAGLAIVGIIILVKAKT